MRSLLLTTILLACSSALAQGTPPDQPLVLQKVLDQLAGDAQLLQHDLPNIVCKETMISQRLKKSKLVEEVKLTAEVRVERNQQGYLAEHYDFKELNGQPYSGPQPKTPFFVEGGMDEAFLFFQPSVQPLFLFTLSPGRLDYKAKKGVESPFVFPPSTHGFATLNSGGAAAHIERRTDSNEARRVHVTDFAAYDFAPAELNGTTYLLTTKNVAESSRGNQTLRFEATLSGCRLFHASSTLLPGVGLVPEVNP